VSTKRASARSRTKLAKAALISPLVLALKTLVCSSMVRAADCTSLNVNSMEALAGLTSTATRAAAGRGTSRPSALAVLLMTSSNFVACWTGTALPGAEAAQVCTRATRTLTDGQAEAAHLA
jgi:hypothetical protein